MKVSYLYGEEGIYAYLRPKGQLVDCVCPTVKVSYFNGEPGT